MSNTVINARIIDQKVQLSNIPLIASGSQGVLQIKCDFDDLWTGYQATAVFFREEKGKVTDVFHVPVYLGIADVPPEVLKEGVFFLSFMGVAENTRTTIAIPLEVKRGAITEGTSVPDPTPDVYTQLLEILNQSGIIPDTTLTQEGKAADAKAAGEAIEKVRTDTAQMVATAKEDLLTDLQAADCIIEWGTEPSTDKYSGNWYWEKWESGKAVCYGTFDFGSISVNSALGNLYRCDAMTKDFPSSLFVGAPYWNANYLVGDGSAWIMPNYTLNNPTTAANTSGFYLMKTEKATITGAVLGFLAVGRWKAEEVIANGTD